MENFYSILKVCIKTLRGLGSLREAGVLSSLFEVWHNHLRPTRRFDRGPALSLTERSPLGPVLGCTLVAEKT